MIQTQVTHSFLQRSWGHDFFIRRVMGQTLEAGGWKEGIRKGDYLILPHSDGTGSTRYQVKEIRYCDDPRDMWFATLTFAPREEG